MNPEQPLDILHNQKILRESSIIKRVAIRPQKNSKPLKKKKKTLKIARCQYETIPFPSKYNTDDQLLIYGNIPLAQKDNTFCCDFSVLNKFYVFRDIRVIHYNEQSILSIKAERRNDARFSRWKTSVKKISRTKNSDLMRWNQTLKKYSHAYEKQIKEYYTRKSEDLNVADHSDENKVEATPLNLNMEQRENKKRALLSRYPCIQLKTALRGFEDRLSEVVVNEKLMHALGYKTDSFISLLLKEGLPQLFESEENKNNSAFLQSIMKAYCTTENYDFQTPEFDIVLLTKSGYAKPARVQVYFMMDLHEESSGSDIIFAVTCHGTPYMPLRYEKQDPLREINQNFVDTMSIDEKNRNDFLSMFYRCSDLLVYTNLYKTCRIKELADMEYTCKAEDHF